MRMMSFRSCTIKARGKGNKSKNVRGITLFGRVLTVCVIHVVSSCNEGTPLRTLMVLLAIPMTFARVFFAAILDAR